MILLLTAHCLPPPQHHFPKGLNMAKTIVEQVMAAHLVSGELAPGAEVALKIDHTLTQDATGTLAYLEFEAMGVERVRPEVAVSYVDHNLPQTDSATPMTTGFCAR